MRTVRTSKVLKQVFFKSTDEHNNGSVCFTVEEVTNRQAQHDGTESVQVYNEYYRNDSRRFTAISRSYFLYDTEAKWNAAMKRVARSAESNYLNSTPEVYRY